MSTNGEWFFEWVVEPVDEYGDIIEPEYDEATLENLIAALQRTPDDWASWGCTRVDVALVARFGNDEDGELERDYAYIENGRLPAEFENGICPWKTNFKYHRMLDTAQMHLRLNK